jgi:hypothetical protein
LLVYLRDRTLVAEALSPAAAARRGFLPSASLRPHFRNIRIRPYTPRTNGQSERFILTLCRE